METIKIELKNGFESCREIYFKNGQESFFSWKEAQIPLVRTIFFLSCTVLFYFLSVKYSEIVWIFLLVVFVFITLISIYVLGRLARQYFKWKIGIDAHLKGLRNYDTQVLTLTAGCVELKNVDETSFHKWENINHVSIKSDYLSMTGKDGTTYLFPKKAMEPGEFDLLAEYIRTKMSDIGGVAVV